MNTKRSIAVALTLLVAVALSPSAHAQDDLSAVVVVEGGQGPSEMKLVASGNNLRMDLRAGDGDVSLVWTESLMRMIMHAQRMYMELSEEMLERMQGMMGQLGQMGSDMPGMQPPSFDADDITEASFETTGATDTISGMSAFEVRVSHPDGQSVSLWMTTDSDVGMFEVITRMAGAFEKMAVPGMQQGGAGMSAMKNSMSLAQAQGMPAGVVLRIVDDQQGTTTTLQEIDTSEVPASAFEAPEGYTKQSMPFGG